MICIIALIVFGILGIFSAKYRIIAKEAFNCMFKKITLRKCDTGLDKRLKSQITGKMMRFSPRLGRALYKYFEVFSWAFLIIMLASLFFVGQAIYNVARYGNCNGPNSNEFCIFDPLAKISPGNVTTSQCSVPASAILNRTLVAPRKINVTPDSYEGNISARVVIIEFGCYSCHYTKQAEPVIKQVMKNYDDRAMYVYIDFPLTTMYPNAMIASEAAHCALDQGKYWQYREYLFANQNHQYEQDLVSYAHDLGLNTTQFSECLESGKYNSTIISDYNLGIASGISVTPTFFINNRTIVGAKDYKDFRNAINSELGVPWWEFWNYW